MDLNQLSAELAFRLDELGLAAGLPILLLSRILLIQGYRRLQLLLWLW